MGRGWLENPTNSDCFGTAVAKTQKRVHHELKESKILTRLLGDRVRLARPHRGIHIITRFFEDIKTHDSESRGQEEAGHTRRMSVLFTGSTGVKFVNALNKPP